MKEFVDQDVLVTGGTGSFGQIIVRQLLKHNVAQVRVFSRDEAKQDLMRERFSDPRIHFITGDVRDADSVVSAMEGADYVFHAAALKQVPNCERHPIEAIRTNTLGSQNVRVAALRCMPKAVVAISTDKACSPINTMGLSKALMERIFLQDYASPRLRDGSAALRFLCVRYGNVVGSRGSVVPLFADRIKAGRPLPITDARMTRFLLLLPDAVETAMVACIHGNQGELWVRKMPAATIAQLVTAMSPRPDYPVETIGVRPGEKMHEVLVNEDEMRRAEERGDYYVVGAAPAMPPPRAGEYTSDNTHRLSTEDLRDLLRRAEMIA